MIAGLLHLNIALRMLSLGIYDTTAWSVRKCSKKCETRFQIQDPISQGLLTRAKHSNSLEQQQQQQRLETSFESHIFLFKNMNIVGAAENFNFFLSLSVFLFMKVICIQVHKQPSSEGRVTM